MKKNIIQITLLTLFTLLISLIINISFPLILLSVLLITVFIQLPQKIQSILSARISAAIIIVLSLFQLESVLFWLTGIQVVPLIYIAATLLIILVWTSYRIANGFQLKDAAIGLRPTKIDLIIIIPAVLLSGLMLTRAIVPKEDNMASIVKSVAYGMDDATHIRLLGDEFRTGSNLTANKQDKYGDTISSAGAYPLGWHLSTSVIASSVISTENIKSQDIVLIYFIAKILSLFGAITSLAFFIIVLADKMKLKIKSFLDVAIYIIISIGISFLLILPLYFDGFFSFFPVVIYTMIFAALYIQKVERQSLPCVELILHLLTIASAFTWILTAPILLLALVFRYYQRFNSIKKIPVRYYAALVFTGACLVIQVLSLLTDNIPVSSLTLVGGIKSPEPFLLLAVLVIYAVFYIKEKDYSELRSKISLLVLPALLSLAAILLFISLKSETITYYFYKFQIVILLILIPVVFVYLILLVKRNLKPLKEQLSAVILLGLIVILSVPSVIGYGYLSHIVTRIQHTLISDQVASQVVTTDLNETFSLQNPVTYYLYPDMPSQAILASNISRMNYPVTECNARMFDATYSGQIEQLVKLAIKCSSTTPTIQIFTDEKSYEKLNEIIPPHYIDTKEIVIKTL